MKEHRREELINILRSIVKEHNDHLADITPQAEAYQRDIAYTTNRRDVFSRCLVAEETLVENDKENDKQKEFKIYKMHRA